MPSPTVSVLMPVFNAERYIAAAIESILAQTFSDFELIVIDDGSSDQSLAILKSYAAKDNRIRLVSRANTGHSRAINEMLAMANGKYLARMDGDDICMPDRFQRQVDCLNAHPDVVAVGGAVQWIDQDGDAIRMFSVGETHEEIDAAHLAGVGGAISHPAAMFRRDAMLAVGGIREETHLAEDIDLFLRLAEIGKLMNLPDVVLKWRLHPASTGATKTRQQHEVKVRVLRDAYERRGLAVPAELAAATADVGDDSPGATQRMWAWWALEAKNVNAARKLAWSALRQSPLNRSSWMTLLCAVRGY
ncbi:MAG: glycosyltransferase [Phycisphaerae bacterium]|nr:glycosyltransferase [Phycisphaerae bacterium]